MYPPRYTLEAMNGDANGLYNRGLELLKSIEGPLRAGRLDVDGRRVAVEAEASLKAALELASNHGRALIMLGTLYRYLGRVGDAIPLFERALGLPKGSDDRYRALEGLASCRMLANDGPGALRVLREALLWHPLEALLHVKIGACLSDAGDVDEAVLALKAALALEPGNAEARRLLDELTTAPPPKAGPVDYAAAGVESQRLAQELQVAILTLMAGPGDPTEKTSRAMKLQEEFQRKIKALYGA